MVTQNVDAQTHRRNSKRTSTADERSEFIELLQALNAGPVRQDRDEQDIRCWNRAAHSHGDRRPSLSVRPSRSVFHCKGCGIHGGLTDLRRHAGRHRGQRSTTRHLRSADHLRTLGSPGADVLSLIPADAVARLRDRTGRHKRDHVLNRNLRAVIAALVGRIDDERTTRNVKFSQVDALRAGIRPQLWCDLLDLLPHLGLDVERGQSGRNLRALSQGRGQSGALAVTLVTVRSETYDPMSHHSSPVSADIGRVIRKRPEATIAAQLATKATPADGPSLARSPALADLLVSFGMFSQPRPATGGTGADTIIDTLTIADLVAMNGKRIRRTLNRAEQMGLVSVVRAGRTHGLVALTDLGIDVLERDYQTGRDRMDEQADRQMERWADYLKRVNSARTVAVDDPFVIDDQTGEIVRFSRSLSGHPLLPHSDGSRVPRADGGRGVLVADAAVCGGLSLTSGQPTESAQNRKQP